MSVAVHTSAQQSSRAAVLESARRVVANGDFRAVTALITLIALLAALSWRKWGVPSIDAGHELTVAASIAEGGEPYRDIRYFYGPAGVYALGAAFAIFGTGLGTAFAFGLLQTAAILAVFYALARQLLSVVPAAIATAMLATIAFSGGPFDFVLPHTSSATFGILFLLTMLLALSRERLIVAGLAAGVVALTRPEFAAVAALCATAFLAGEARQSGPRAAFDALPRLFLPALAVSVPVLAALAVDAGVGTLFTESLWPVDFLRVAGFDAQRDWAPLDLESVVSTLARASAYCIGLAALLATGLLLHRAHGTGQRVRALLPLAGACCVVLLLGAAWREAGVFVNARLAVEKEITHLLLGMSWLPALGFAACILVAFALLRRRPPPLSGSWGLDLALVAVAGALGTRAYDAFTAEASYAPYYAAPLVLLLAVLHDRLGRRIPEARLAATLGLAAVAAGLLAYAQFGLYRDNQAEVRTARGAFLTTSGSAPALQQTIDFLRFRTAPGEPILTLPADAGLHFMVDRPPALYDVMFIPGLLDSRRDEIDAIARLEAERVRYVVVSRRRFDHYGFSRFGIEYNQLLYARIRRDGPPLAVFGGGPRAAGTNPATAYAIYRIRH